LYQARRASGKAAPIRSDMSDAARAVFLRHLGAVVVDLLVETVIVAAVLFAAAGGSHMLATGDAGIQTLRATG